MSSVNSIYSYQDSLSHDARLAIGAVSHSSPQRRVCNIASSRQRSCGLILASRRCSAAFSSSNDVNNSTFVPRSTVPPPSTSIQAAPRDSKPLPSGRITTVFPIILPLDGAVLSHLRVLTAEPKAEGRKPRSGASERTVTYMPRPSIKSKTTLGAAPRRPRHETQ